MAFRRVFRSAGAVVLASILPTGAVSQAQSGAKERNPRTRDEDQVAHLFEALRAKEELPRLTRIAHRESLEELVCTAALRDAAVWGENRPGALMYRTNDPASSNGDLEQIARFKDPLERKDQPRITRYAVAVWPSSARESERPVYWVGVKVYMSAWREFIDSNFTDDRGYKNEWKKLVAPQCRGVQ